MRFVNYFLPGMLVGCGNVFGTSGFTLKSIASASIRTSELSKVRLLLLLTLLLDVGDAIRVAYSFDKPIIDMTVYHTILYPLIFAIIQSVQIITNHVAYK